jgi:hypothetical protein
VRTAAYHRDISDAFRRIFAIDSSNPNYDVANKVCHNVPEPQVVLSLGVA